jgi:hypothetical protein
MFKFLCFYCVCVRVHVCFIDFVILCAVLLFECCVLFCMLCLIVPPLPPGTNPFAVKININKIYFENKLLPKNGGSTDVTSECSRMPHVFFSRLISRFS